MKIRSKLRINAALPVGLMLLTGAIFFLASQYVSDVTERGRTANTIVKGVFELTIITDEYLLHRGERAQMQWNLKYESLNKLLKTIDFKAPREQAILQRIRQEHQGLKATFSELASSYVKQDFAKQDLVDLKFTGLGQKIAEKGSRKAIVTARQLNVRPEPSTRRPRIGQLRRGTQVEILGDEDSWYRIRAGTLAGYVHTGYLNLAQIEAAKEKGVTGKGIEKNHLAEESDESDEMELAEREFTILQELGRRLVGQLLSKSQAMVSGGLQLSSISQAKVVAAEQQTALVIMGFVLVLGLVMAGTSLLINRSVVKPIAKVREGTEIIAKGDLDHRLGIKSDDEIGDLSRTFDQMMDNLKTTTASRDELNKAHEELKKSTSQLIQSEKMASIGQMVAGVAHEINTPLAYVRSSVEFVRDEMPDLEKLIAAYDKLTNLLTSSGDEQALSKQFEIVTEIATAFHENHSPEESKTLLTRGIHGLDQIRELVMNLKNFSRLDRAKVADYDLNEGLDSVLLLTKPVLKNRIKVVKQYGQISPVACSPAQINQVFLNVISNAAHAIEGDDGTILIQTRSKGEQVQVLIRDSGKGVPAESLSKIFDPFFTTKKVGEGTGLGLSIARKIMEEHGGTIKMNSVIGKGSVVTILLPTHGELDQRMRA